MIRHHILNYLPLSSKSYDNPWVPLIQLGPWRSHIFVDMFLEIVAWYGKFIGYSQTSTNTYTCPKIFTKPKGGEYTPLWNHE